MTQTNTPSINNEPHNYLSNKTFENKTFENKNLESESLKNKTPKSDNPDHKKSITRRVCVAIIGAGTAGQNAFRQAQRSTENIVIINDGIWTTTCATVGCMPSKLLIAAADRAFDAKHSANFGISGDIHIDGHQVMRRVRHERDYFTSNVQQQVTSWDDDKKISGKAYINNQGDIEVNDEVIQADKIIIATGSSPFIPDGWLERLKDKLLTSDTVFELADLPKSLAVVGAGAIGLELAQAFSRLGVAVTLFNRERQVGGLKDKEVNQKAIDCLSSELNLQLNSHIHEVGLNQDDKASAFINFDDQSGQPQSWHGDFVLVATGRRNHLKALGVENLGVTLDDKERPQHLNLNTGQIGDLEVYIIGDANAHLPLLHVASDEGFSAGSAVGDNSFGAYIRPPATPLSIIFSSPQIATVGQSLTDIQNAKLNCVIGKVSFDNQGRSRIMGVNCGLLHIYACKETDQILGASMAAPDAEYLAHILATAITNQLSVKQLLDAPFYHPTILEGLRTALRDIQSKMNIPHQTEGDKGDAY